MTAEYIAKQTRRLMQLPFSPVEEKDRTALLKEFGRIVKNHCVSEEHLSEVIDYLIAHERSCPPPAALVEAAQTVVPTEAKQPLGCEKCQGTGWYHFSKWVQPQKTDGYMADHCTFCNCEAGQWRKTKVREYEAKKK